MPSITKKLLSVGSSSDEDKTLIFKSAGCFIVDNDTLNIVSFAPRENGRDLYKLGVDLTTLDPEANLLHHQSQATLWHKRLGHFHIHGIQQMINFEVIHGVPNICFSKQICSGCQLRKHIRTKMPKEATFHASRTLELIYSNVCGPFRVKSTGGARYFVTFVDDFSKKLWVYFISHKNQVLIKFR